MLIPNFPGNLEERMEKLNTILSGKSGIILVGSSFGGLMASIFALEHEARVKKLILLAPAINLMDPSLYGNRTVSAPVWIYHGRSDAVIPLEGVEKTASKIFSNLSFQRVEDDHFLHNTFKTIDWDEHLSD